MQPVALLSLFLGLVLPAAADDGAALTAGFRPHRQAGEGGTIDWTAGVIIAHGKGVAAGTDQQQRLLARQAARTVAARNALALAAGIPVSDRGIAGNIGNGRVVLEGMIRGHEIASEEWLPQNNPPQCHVELHVPLWGVKSVAAQFFREEVRTIARTGMRRVTLSDANADVSDMVLVIDARGTRVSPCLYPRVTDPTGAILYDVATPPMAIARNIAIVRYVESDVEFEKLRSMFERPETGVRLASYEQDVESQPASMPATQPAEDASRRRPRRRNVVKAVQAAGQDRTRLVLTQEDADKLRNSPEGTALLRSAQVVIVVDSAAAGIQGARPVAPSRDGLVFPDSSPILPLPHGRGSVLASAGR